MRRKFRKKYLEIIIHTSLKWKEKVGKLQDIYKKFKYLKKKIALICENVYRKSQN